MDSIHLVFSSAFDSGSALHRQEKINKFNLSGLSKQVGYSDARGVNFLISTDDIFCSVRFLLGEKGIRLHLRGVGGFGVGMGGVGVFLCGDWLELLVHCVYKMET